ncbi:TraB/GumN family protein [Dokdonella sp.]|uniref:TraB/GumN family protein n=1 Tax=Dokdonella sp. TaxID=2291710 RepID=UPI003C3BD505
MKIPATTLGRRVIATLIACLLLAPAAKASEVPADSVPASGAGAEFATLDTIVVSGEQPGPGLWKVSKDDHELWILGTLSPLPKRMSWVSRDVEAIIADSQEVILMPNVSLSVKGGMIRGLFLLPSLMKARNNPDKEKLVDVVPPDLYARWKVLKARYMGNGNSVEKRRPIFAAYDLYESAIKRSGLSQKDVVSGGVKKAARRNKVELVEPELDLRIESPGSALRDFRKSSLDDLDCFAKTMSRLETDIEAMKLRGNAWATGDIEAIQSLPYTDQLHACSDAILNASVVEERGLADLRPRIYSIWLTAAESSLQRNAKSFAILPMRLLLADDGLLTQLRDRGYTIDPPE